MRNATPIWNPYQETTRNFWIGMEFVWLSHPHSFPILCLMWTFQPMYFPYCGNEQKITPYQCHTTIWPSHISATYGSHMAQTLPYLSHSFALVRVITSVFFTWTNLARIAGMMFVCRDRGTFVKRIKNQLCDYMAAGPAWLAEIPVSRCRDPG